MTDLELVSTDELAIEILRRSARALVITDRQEINTDPEECSFVVRCSPSLTKDDARFLLRETASTLKELFDAQQD